MLEELKGRFWTDKNDLIEDVNEVGYEVLEINDEYMVIADDDYEVVIYLNVAGSTITIL